jgi:transposase InsO family protein
MARRNGRWGTRRIVGELLKLGHSVHRRTVQRTLESEGPRYRPAGQSWWTFLRNHLELILALWRRVRNLSERIWALWKQAFRPPLEDHAPQNVARRHPRGDGTWANFLREHAKVTWACDFLTVYTVTFERLHVFFLMKLGTREVIQWGATKHPTDAWTARQLALAIQRHEPPEFLVRDRDGKFGSEFSAVARANGIKTKVTPKRAPRANPYAERFVGSARRECLNHFGFGDDVHLEKILTEYIDGYFNLARPHQGIDQQIPCEVGTPRGRPRTPGRVRRHALLNGLIHAYSREPAVAA